MGRKVFISTLGTGFYQEGKYSSNDTGFVSSSTRFIQQATAEYLSIDRWTDKDAAIFLLTEKARRENWSVNARKDRKGDEVSYIGLEFVWKEMSLPVTVRDLSIPEGKNEEEIWDIFSTLYKELQDGDELYFDVTHGFRNLPMLVIVLGNYSKFLKNTTVRSITYGGFENKDKATGYAPIINLLPLSMLQDWTFAAADYLQNGNVNDLKSLCISSITPVLASSKGKDENAVSLRKFLKTLETYTEEVKSCRGRDLYSKATVCNLYGQIGYIGETIIAPMNPIIEKMRDSFTPYVDGDELQNLYLSAQWCFTKGLYQSAITILQEAIVTGICVRTGLGNIGDPDVRKLVTDAIWYSYYKINNEESNFSGALSSEAILADIFFRNKENITKYSSLSDLRNDFNHSGMRKQSLSPRTLQAGIADMLEYFRPLFNL